MFAPCKDSSISKAFKINKKVSRFNIFENRALTKLEWTKKKAWKKNTECEKSVHSQRGYIFDFLKSQFYLKCTHWNTYIEPQQKRPRANGNPIKIEKMLFIKRYTDDKSSARITYAQYTGPKSASDSHSARTTYRERERERDVYKCCIINIFCSRIPLWNSTSSLALSRCCVFSVVFILRYRCTHIVSGISSRGVRRRSF